MMTVTEWANPVVAHRLQTLGVRLNVDQREVAMHPIHTTRSTLQMTLLLGALAMLGCGDGDPDASVDAGVDAVDPEDDSGSSDGVCENTSQGMSPEHFFAGSVAEEIVEEDCTLTNGVETTCYRVVAAGEPTNHELTTVCPRTIEDEATGFWNIDGQSVDVDGPFIVSLATVFDDPSWQMYDPDTGKVFVTETAEECLAAGGMPLDPGYANYCVECTLEHIGGAMTIEYLIPTRPVMADEPTELAQLAPGVSLNGVQFEFPADIDTIESGLQIAPIDVCGGHVNFNIGYHYHEELGCIGGVEQCDGHAALIGYARDGFGIYEMTDENGEEPADLDPCRGHTDDARGYHYHALGVGENAIIGCLSGVPVEGGGGMGPGGGPPGM